MNVLFLLLLLAFCGTLSAFSLRISAANKISSVTQSVPSYHGSSPVLFSKDTDDLEETTKKYGLEAGLWKSMTSKDTTKTKPQDLLAKYGAAYLITSISFAIVSYAICYVLVANGIDVASLLEKFGIKATSSAANAGTAGIAYAIHKAASPIRFPPTVALTPVVANWIGKKPSDNEKP